MSNPSTKNKFLSSIESKLLLMLFVVAVIPIGTLVASLAVGMLQFEAIVGSIVVQGLGLALGYRFVYQVSRQAASINDTLIGITNGDFEARDSFGSDELGQAAASLNAMCDNTLNLIQSNDERDQIQTSIENLISQMKEIAAGNLTITTDVNPDMTGSIAQSVNHMTEQLRSIVQQVQSAAEQVTDSSMRIREASTTMSQESDDHASRISAASTQLLHMTDSFQNVASLTKDSVAVAVDARQSASEGLKAVSDTVDGMQRIRNQVQNTSKRIKRFGESSQEIGEIVQLISDISDRTSILALNASIQALMAGDAGHGFAVVAEEIERLAERSTDATKQISKLIRGIQHETTEVISDMEESTREVVAGSELAAQAGETLFEIDSVSNQLVDLIQASSSSALQQAHSATEIAESMSAISASTKESAEKSREATRSVGLLADMVNELSESVSQFKVSDTANSTPAAKHPTLENLLAKPDLASAHRLASANSTSTPAPRPVATAPANVQPVQRSAAQTISQPGTQDSQPLIKTRAVAGTMMIPDGNSMISQFGEQTSEREIDERLERQLEQARELNAVSQPPPKSSPSKTMSLDSAVTGSNPSNKSQNPDSAPKRKSRSFPKTTLNSGDKESLLPSASPGNRQVNPTLRQRTPTEMNQLPAKTMFIVEPDSSTPEDDSDSNSIDETLLKQLQATQNLLNEEQSKKADPEALENSPTGLADGN